MSQLPSRDPLEIYTPYTLSITDHYGETITLSRSSTSGDVLNLSIGGYDDRGRPTSVELTGNFHKNTKQNAINFLARLRGLKRISDREDQQSVLIVPHPQIEMRGRVTALDGPNWQSTPHPIFFNFSFTFSRDAQIYMPMHFKDPSEVLTAEGEDYVWYTIPTGVTTLRDLAYTYFGETFRDGGRIRKIIMLNSLKLDSAITPGAQIKMPR